MIYQNNTQPAASFRHDTYHLSSFVVLRSITPTPCPIYLGRLCASHSTHVHPEYHTPGLPAHHLDDWERSDKYHNSFLIPPDPALEAAAKRSDERGLPEIAVSPAQGKFLNLLAQSIGAKRILEVGTLGG